MTQVRQEQTFNVGARLTATASRLPDGVAVAAPQRRMGGKRRYRQVTFRELDEDSDQLAAALHSLGATPGTRLVLMVRPSIEFISSRRESGGRGPSTCLRTGR